MVTKKISGNEVNHYSKGDADKHFEYKDIDLYREFDISLWEVDLFNKLYQNLLSLTENNFIKKVSIDSNKVKDILMDSKELHWKLTELPTDYVFELKKRLDKYDDYDIDHNADTKQYSLYLKEGNIVLKERNTFKKKLDNTQKKTRSNLWSTFSKRLRDNPAVL